MRRDNEPYTEAELKRVIELKSRLSLTWPEVAIRFGREHASLAVAVSRYRRGLMKFANQKAVFDADAQEIVDEMIRDGVSMSEVARRRGRAPGSVHRSLARRGWDAETINEYRQEAA
jgi:cyanate lyase